MHERSSRFDLNSFLYTCRPSDELTLLRRTLHEDRTLGFGGTAPVTGGIPLLRTKVIHAVVGSCRRSRQTLPQPCSVFEQRESAAAAVTIHLVALSRTVACIIARDFTPILSPEVTAKTRLRFTWSADLPVLQIGTKECFNLEETLLEPIGSRKR